MALAGSLDRLAHVRALEAEQSLATLEAAINEVRQLQYALALAQQQAKAGRELIHCSAQTGELVDRLAGIEELRKSRKAIATMEGDLVVVEATATEVREVYLARRMERQQAEALVKEARTQEERLMTRRSQQEVEDWHRAQQMREAPLQSPAE